MARGRRNSQTHYEVLSQQSLDVLQHLPANASSFTLWQPSKGYFCVRVNNIQLHSLQNLTARAVLCQARSSGRCATAGHCVGAACGSTGLSGRLRRTSCSTVGVCALPLAFQYMEEQVWLARGWQMVVSAQDGRGGRVGWPRLCVLANVWA